MKLLKLGARMASAAAVCALLIPGAASAAPATFSSTGPLTWQLDGQLQVRTSQATWNCTSAQFFYLQNGTTSAASNAGSPSQGTVNFFGFQGGGCNAGWAMVLTGQLAGTGTVPLTVSSAAGVYTIAGPDQGMGFSGIGSPTWTNGSFQARWLNGTSPSNPSVVVFNNTVVGTIGGIPVTVTGRFKVSVNGSGLITAS